MHEELVARLRDRARREDEYYAHGGDVINEAADAIEEMSRDIDISNEAMTAMYGAIPHWIPVTERLPKTRESILGKKSSKVIVAFRFDDGTQGTDTAHTLNGEWVFEDHITVVARTITHWMPLPEPPKEEQDDI